MAAGDADGAAVELGEGLGQPLRLVSAPGVHWDPDNEPLLRRGLRHAPLSGAFLDIGCGSGVWGLAALRLGAPTATLADVQPESVAAARDNAERNGLAGRCRVVQSDMLAGVKGQTGGFACVFMNPPQTGGPPEFQARRPDKCGGRDGAAFYLRLLEEGVEDLLAPGGAVLVMQISLSDEKRVQAAFEARGFAMRELASQERQLDREALDALCPGLFAHQLALRELGSAAFTDTGDGRHFRYRQTLKLFQRAEEQAECAV